MPRPVSEILEKLHQKPLVRTFSVDRKAVEESTRTINLAFASNKPVEQWFGILSLTMNKAAMRSERMRSGAPLLMDHDPRDVVGVVENHAIGSDGVARATVRFGESIRATEIFRDVVGGIRRNVSVGFRIFDLQYEGNHDGVDVYRSDSWEPYEISLVSVPGDISVGVGRSIQKVRKNMPEEFEENNGRQLTGQIAIAAEIREWGKQLRCEDLATSYLQRSFDNGAFIGSREGFFAAVRASQPPSTQVPAMDSQTSAYRQGGPRTEFARSIPRYGKLTAFTGEGGEQRAYRFGQWILGGPMGNEASRAWCQQNGVTLSRAAQIEGIDTKGGFTVPEEFGQDFVQLLEEYGVFRRNAHIVPMSSDRRTDPVLNGELESQFVGEMQEGDDQDLDFGMIGYTAKKHMILVPFSSELNEDSVISIGDHLADASARAYAKKEDLCGFLGDATSTYGGIVGITTALKSVDGTIANIKGLQVATGNAYSEIVLNDFARTVKRLPTYARKNAKWYMSDDFYWDVVVPLLLAAGGTTIGEIEASRGERLFGKPIEFVEVMPTTEANSQVCAILGDLQLGARLADRRLFTYKVDDSILIRKDALLFQSTARFDINCAFGVGDTTKAGPIVGLITAAS